MLAFESGTKSSAFESREGAKHFKVALIHFVSPENVLFQHGPVQPQPEGPGWVGAVSSLCRGEIRNSLTRCAKGKSMN